MRNRLLQHDSWQRPLVLLPLVVAVLSCGSKGSGPQKTAEDFAAEGWEEFLASDYPAALSSFQEAIAKDADYSDGYLGSGWASLYAHQSQSALTHFSNGKAKAAGVAALADFHAGSALARFDLEQYSQCIADVDSCLANAASYSFSHRSSINATDLKVAKANSYFQRGGDVNLSMAAGIVHEIDPTINLDPARASTWRVGGKTYGTFSEALLRALERVSEAAASG